MQAPNGHDSGAGRIGTTLALLDGILRITGVISVASLSQEFVVWSNWIALAISWYKAVMYPAVSALFSSLNLFDPSNKFEKAEPSAEIPPQEDGVAESRDYPMNAEESEPLLQVSPNLKEPGCSENSRQAGSTLNPVTHPLATPHQIPRFRTLHSGNGAPPPAQKSGNRTNGCHSLFTFTSQSVQTSRCVFDFRLA